VASAPQSTLLGGGLLREGLPHPERAVAQAQRADGLVHAPHGVAVAEAEEKPERPPAEAQRVADGDAPREVGPGERALDAPVVLEGAGHRGDVLGRESAVAGAQQHRRNRRGERPGAVVEAERVEAAAARGEHPAGVGVGVGARGERELQQQALREVAGGEAERSAGEVAGHVGGEGLVEREAVEQARGEEVELHPGLVGVRRRERRAVEEGVDVAAAEAPHDDEVLVAEAHPDDASDGVARGGVGRAGDLLGAHPVAHRGRLAALLEHRRGGAGVGAPCDDGLLGGPYLARLQRDLDARRATAADEHVLDAHREVQAREDPHRAHAGGRGQHEAAVDVAEHHGAVAAHDANLRVGDGRAGGAVGDAAGDDRVRGSGLGGLRERARGEHRRRREEQRERADEAMGHQRFSRRKGTRTIW
jgi:hypothetical protein